MTGQEITVADAAKALGVSERTVWRYLRSGRLVGRTEGEPGFQRTLIDAASLESARAGATTRMPAVAQAPPASGPDAPAPIDPGATLEIERLTAALAAARAEADGLRADADRLRAEATVLRADADSARAERDAARAADDAPTGEVAGLRDEIARLEREGRELRARVDRLQRALARPRPAVLGRVAEGVLAAGARIERRRSR